MAAQFLNTYAARSSYDYGPLRITADQARRRWGFLRDLYLRGREAVLRGSPTPFCSNPLWDPIDRIFFPKGPESHPNYSDIDQKLRHILESMNIVLRFISGQENRVRAQHQSMVFIHRAQEDMVQVLRTIANITFGGRATSDPEDS